KNAVYEPVPADKEREALDFFDKQLFTTPYWILDSTVISKVSMPSQPNFVEDLQVKALNKLLDIGKINQILANRRQFGDKALSVEEYLKIIHQIIWKELKTGRPIDPYRRNLQKSYVGALQVILTSNKPEVTETDVYSIARADFVRLQIEVRQVIPKLRDDINKYHLQDIDVRIKNTLEAKLSMQ
ncbi:MAG TPA: zinc-dependent metalloprotease, partial [Puia sp.]|nr:zinc-dependent metalloprotease [Puia sp.]